MVYSPSTLHRKKKYDTRTPLKYPWRAPSDQTEREMFPRQEQEQQIPSAPGLPSALSPSSVSDFPPPEAEKLKERSSSLLFEGRAEVFIPRKSSSRKFRGGDLYAEVLTPSDLDQGVEELMTEEETNPRLMRIKRRSSESVKRAGVAHHKKTASSDSSMPDVRSCITSSFEQDSVTSTMSVNTSKSCGEIFRRKHIIIDNTAHRKRPPKPTTIRHRRTLVIDTKNMDDLSAASNHTEDNPTREADSVKTPKEDESTSESQRKAGVINMSDRVKGEPSDTLSTPRNEENTVPTEQDQDDLADKNLKDDVASPQILVTPEKNIEVVHGSRGDTEKQEDPNENIYSEPNDEQEASAVAGNVNAKRSTAWDEWRRVAAESSKRRQQQMKQTASDLKEDMSVENSTLIGTKFVGRDFEVVDEETIEREEAASGRDTAEESCERDEAASTRQSHAQSSRIASAGSDEQMSRVTSCIIMFEKLDQAISLFQQVVETAQHDVAGPSTYTAANLDPLTSALLKFTKKIRGLEASVKDRHAVVTELLMKAGNVLFAGALYPSAVVAFEEALRVRESVLGVHNTDVARINNNLGCSYCEVRLAEKALECLQHALGSLYADTMGHTDDVKRSRRNVFRIATVLCNIGYFFLKEGRFDEAIPIYEEALEMQRKIVSPDHDLILHTTDNLKYARRQRRNIMVRMGKRIIRKQTIQSWTMSGSGFSLFRN